MTEQEAREALGILYSFGKKSSTKRVFVDKHIKKMIADSGGAWSKYYAKQYMMMLESQIKIG